MFQIFLFRECSSGICGVGLWEKDEEEGEEVEKPCCRGWFRCRPLSGCSSSSSATAQLICRHFGSNLPAAERLFVVLPPVRAGCG